MPEQNQPQTHPATQFQCRHIHADGRRCGSVCLRNEPFCYFHHTTRRPVTNPSERKGRRSTFALPLIEDRASIQLAISHILARIASNEIDPRRAGLLLYGLQIASVNLPRLSTQDAKLPEQLTVEETTEDPEQGQIAPPTPWSERSGQPQTHSGRDPHAPVGAGQSRRRGPQQSPYPDSLCLMAG